MADPAVATMSDAQDSSSTTGAPASTARDARDARDARENTIRPRRGGVRAWWRLLASEARLIMGRRRNQWGLAILAVPPIIMAYVLRQTGADTGGLFALVGSSGLIVPIIALTAEITLFLPLAVGMLSGDTIAGEAHSGTLRYVLTVPVSRTRLLWTKFCALAIGAAIGVAVVVGVGVIAGSLLMGTGPMLTLSGTELGYTEMLGRVALASVYVWTGLLALAAIGLLVSTLTEQPIAVTVVVVVVVSLMWILGNLPQLDWLHPWLLTDRWLAFNDLLRDPPFWDVMRTGVAVNAAYGLVAYATAWARFTTKDVTS